MNKKLFAIIGWLSLAWNPVMASGAEIEMIEIDNPLDRQARQAQDVYEAMNTGFNDVGSGVPNMATQNPALVGNAQQIAQEGLNTMDNAGATAMKTMFGNYSGKEKVEEYGAGNFDSDIDTPHTRLGRCCLGCYLCGLEGCAPLIRVTFFPLTILGATVGTVGFLVNVLVGSGIVVGSPTISWVAAGLGMGAVSVKLTMAIMHYLSENIHNERKKAVDAMEKAELLLIKDLEEENKRVRRLERALGREKGIDEREIKAQSQMRKKNFNQNIKNYKEMKHRAIRQERQDAMPDFMKGGGTSYSQQDLGEVV